MKLGGSSMIYSCHYYKEMLSIKHLIPLYTILGPQDVVPGLSQGRLPKQPSNQPMSTIPALDVYLKNVEINVSHKFENGLLQFAAMYREKKYGNII
jgi:hypothetical protein